MYRWDTSEQASWQDHQESIGFVAGLPDTVAMSPERVSTKRERIHVTRPPHCTHTHVAHMEFVATESPRRRTVGSVEFRENAESYAISPMFAVLLFRTPRFVHPVTGPVTHHVVSSS